jgi:hypothetical protein
VAGTAPSADDSIESNPTRSAPNYSLYCEQFAALAAWVTAGAESSWEAIVPVSRSYHARDCSAPRLGFRVTMSKTGGKIT